MRTHATAGHQSINQSINQFNFNTLRQGAKKTRSNYKRVEIEYIIITAI